VNGDSDAIVNTFSSGLEWVFTIVESVFTMSESNLDLIVSSWRRWLTVGIVFSLFQGEHRCPQKG